MTHARRILWLVLPLAALWWLGRPAAFLAWAWWNDSSDRPTTMSAGHADASGFESVSPAEVIAVSPNAAEAEKQLTALVARAAAESRKIVVGGAQHSMGGHTLYPGGIAVDMRPFHAMSVDETHSLLHVGAGARWSEVIPFLDRHGLAVAVMPKLRYDPREIFQNEFYRKYGRAVTADAARLMHSAPQPRPRDCGLPRGAELAPVHPVSAVLAPSCEVWPR